MDTRIGHRVRWTLVVLLLALWFATLVVDISGAWGTLVLVLAAAVLFYELLAVDRTAS